MTRTSVLVVTWCWKTTVAAVPLVALAFICSPASATKVVDLKGKTVIPGLIDSHVHANGAAMHEFDHEIPDMETIDDVLKYIKSMTKVRDEDQWIWVSQVFITRLKEQRFPTRAELDGVA